MKKICILLFCLPFVVFFNSCESNYVSHQNVGKHVFQILQTLDTLPKDNFRNHFITFDQIKNMIKNVKNGKKLIPKVAEMSTELYNSDIDDIYHLTKEDAENNYIHWKNIEFVNYKYQTTRNRSMTMNYGTLVFKNNEEKFSLKVYWLTDLHVSGLLGLGGLQRVE